MQKILLSLFLFSTLFAKAQLVNINPDKSGEPWLVGGWKNLSKKELAQIDKIPVVKLPNYKTTKDLPSYLDNSTNSFFRPVFTQSDGSCSQASGVAYNFTYEINRQQNTDALLAQNQFPTHFTYNFLNLGSGDNGSTYFDGWAILQQNGCPALPDYGNGLATYGPKQWISGYQKYINSMQNRVEEVIAFDLKTAEGLLTLKNWMYDHLDGSPVGGIANFAAGISSNNGYTISNNIVTHWGSVVNHAMTFVGWDDTIEYDFNNDGKITTDIDITGDGIVDLRDREKGALIMVNSWGLSWGNQGKAYVMYKLLAEPVENGGIQSNKAFSIIVKPVFEPKLILKTKISHASRDIITIKAGVSSNLNAETPDFEIHFPLFNNQGGSLSMQGTNTNPLELALDITPLLTYAENNSETKYFLVVQETDDNNSAGGIVSEFSVLDYESGQEFTSTQVNVAIAENAKTYLSVNATIDFDAPEITTESLSSAVPNQFYSSQLQATGGHEPYKWNMVIDYSETENTETFPVATEELTPTDYDDGYAPLTLDFEFPFYGQKSDKIVVNTDGSLIFVEEFNYLRSEQAIMDNKMIAPFAYDLRILEGTDNGIFYSGNENEAVIRWKTALWEDENAKVEVAVRLLPSGEIQFFYGNEITPGLAFASGISNGTGVSYLLSSTSGVENPSSLKIGFLPASFPLGMSISKEGVFSGTPTEISNTWDLKFRVSDYKNISRVKTLNFSTQSLSVKNSNSDNTFNVYPNPCKELLFVEFFSEKTEIVQMKIYNTSGQLISTQSKLVKPGKNKLKVDLNKNLKPGTYVLELILGNEKHRKNIMVN